MGIPTFTRQLLKKHNISKKTIENVDSLYIDFNGQIYPSVYKAIDFFSDKEEINTSQLKKKIFEGCFASLDDLIKKANPNKLVYMAIDGVAPRAKMHQQRLRRYKIKDNSIFDTNCITPGTKFMEDLTIYIKKMCKKHYSDSNFKIIFSHYHYAGEGEHKILSYLRNHKNTIDEKSCIIGLDADLFMLMLSLPHKDVFIMREEQDSDMIKKYGEVHYVSIEALKADFKEVVEENVNIEVDIQRIAHDYILLCFFGGNDFLPHIPSTEIRFGGIDKLLEIYWKHLDENNGYLTNNGNIVWESFKKFLNDVLVYEEDMIRYIGVQMKNWTPRSNFSNEKEKQKYLEELIYPVNDPVNYNSPGWRIRYYKHCFNMNFIDNKDVQDICFEYLKTMEWNIKYYINGCPDWEHYYPYNHAPFMKDIINSLRYYKSFEFEEHKPCTPYEQLMCVLPVQSKSLIPKTINKLMSSKHLIPYYPIRVELDTIFCNMTWQCKPNLPLMDYDKIQKHVRDEFDNLSETQRRYNELK